MKAVNLLPSDQSGATKAPIAAKTPASSGGSAFGAWLVIGALGFAVAATAAYVLVTNTIKDRKAELARVQQEAEVVQAKAASLQSFADFQTLAQQRLTTVRDLASSRFDWERTLSDLSRALPEDVYLSTLKGSTNSEAAAGGSTVRGAIQAPAIEMSGCTGSQHDVAELMSRLGNVRGVTRVALAKSDKDSTATAVQTPVAGGDEIPAKPCPDGSPPSFDLVVFFERAQLPAGAAPNLPGTAAAAPQAGAAAAPGATQAPGATGTTTPGTTPGGQTPPAAGGTQPTAPGATQGVSTQ